MRLNDDQIRQLKSELAYYKTVIDVLSEEDELSETTSRVLIECVTRCEDINELLNSDGS